MFYFVFGINNSGTTVVSQYLAAQSDAYLPPGRTHEGQKIPSVRSIFRTQPWREHKAIDWPFVRQEWEALMHAGGKHIFVEGSPPNLIRVGEVRDVFSDGHKGMLLISDPYMQIASCLKNYTRPPMDDALIESFCKRWIRKANFQRRNDLEFPDLPLITYEAFCADPTLVNHAFELPIRTDVPAVAGKVSWRARAMQSIVPGIKDLSTRNVAFLAWPEIERISQVLSAQSDLLDYFGYALLDKAGFDARLAKDPDQADQGRRARQKWERSR